MGFWDNFWPAHLGFWGVPGISNTPRKISPLENPQNGTQPASLLEIFPTLRTSSYFFHIPSIAIQKKMVQNQRVQRRPFSLNHGPEVNPCHLTCMKLISCLRMQTCKLKWVSDLCVCHPCALAMLTVMSTNLNALQLATVGMSWQGGHVWFSLVVDKSCQVLG